MNKKKLIWSITGVIAAILIIFFAYRMYENGVVKPGIAALEKKGIALIYCSQNDNMPTVVKSVSKAVKLKTYKVEPVVAYPKDKNAYETRIKDENSNLSKILYKDVNVDLKKYGLVIFATPLVDGNVCPVLKRYIIDNRTVLVKKPVARILLRRPDEDTRDAMQYFYFRLYDSYTKPALILEDKDFGHLRSMTNSWLDQMVFRRLELK